MAVKSKPSAVRVVVDSALGRGDSAFKRRPLANAPYGWYLIWSTVKRYQHLPFARPRILPQKIKRHLVPGSKNLPAGFQRNLHRNPALRVGFAGQNFQRFGAGIPTGFPEQFKSPLEFCFQVRTLDTFFEVVPAPQHQLGDAGDKQLITQGDVCCRHIQGGW